MFKIISKHSRNYLNNGKYAPIKWLPELFSLWNAPEIMQQMEDIEVLSHVARSELWALLGYEVRRLLENKILCRSEQGSNPNQRSVFFLFININIFCRCFCRFKIALNISHCKSYNILSLHITHTCFYYFTSLLFIS